MRRLVMLGALVGVAVLVARARGAKLHERVMAHCEVMFEQMPDTFPPKRMMRGIDEIRDTTDRIIGLLQAGENVSPRPADAGSSEGVHRAA